MKLNRKTLRALMKLRYVMVLISMNLIVGVLLETLLIHLEVGLLLNISEIIDLIFLALNNN